MLDIYAREFVAIGIHLMAKGNKKGEYILVARNDLEEMMNRNQYDTARNKLKIWKGLGWIDTDKDRRYTRRVYDKDKGYVTCIKMSHNILILLQSLCKQPQKPA